MQKETDALQKEIAAYFCQCRKSMTQLMKKLGITRKKRRIFTKSETKKSEKNS
jgi:hypothetical protein